MDIQELLSKENKEIFLINNRHIVICGSSLDNAYDALISNAKINAVITDPPYGIDLLGGRSGTIGESKTSYKPVHGDNNTALFKEFYSKRILGCGIKNYLIFGGNYFAPILPSSKGWITWDKKVSKKVTFSRSELIYTSFYNKTDVIEYTYSGNNIEKEERDYNYKRIHPTQKPIGLLRQLINLIPNQDSEGFLLDGFAGSLSLMAAAEFEGKRSISFELEADYVEQGIEFFKRLFPDCKVEKYKY